MNPSLMFANHVKEQPPNQMITYKHAILLHKIYNINLPQADWVDLNSQQICTSPKTSFKIMKTNNNLIENTILSRRFATLNNKIDLNDLNLSLDTFNIKYKARMLS